MSFPEWGGGGSGLWSEPAAHWGSVCVHVVVGLFVVSSSSRSTPTALTESEPTTVCSSHLVSPGFVLVRWGFVGPAVAPGLLIGTCMSWASVRRLRSVRSSFGDPLTTTGGVHSFNLFYKFDRFCGKVYALKLSERSTS